MFLVAGGWDGSTYRNAGEFNLPDFFTSTEMLTRTSSAWVIVNNLPRKMTGVRGVTLGGVLYMTG